MMQKIEERSEQVEYSLMSRYLSEFKQIAQQEIAKYHLPFFLENDISVLLDFCIDGGKLIRGQIVVRTLRFLAVSHSQQPREGICSEEELRIGCLVGWCIEMIQAFFLIADDVMDQSETRRGKACWYKIVGLGAINDAVLLESLTFCILKRIVPHQVYLELSELVRSIIFRTELGQALDMNLPHKTEIADFCMKDYLQMVTYKTAYYTFVFPVEAGFILWGHLKEGDNLCETHKNASKLGPSIPVFGELEPILVRIGQLFQVQDDYLDCFGDAALTGKIGTDIQDKKYSWLAVKAVELLKGDEQGLAVLRDNYGNTNGGEDSIHRVKQLYQQLHLEEAFKKWEQEVLDEIGILHSNIQPLASKNIIKHLCEMIRHRKK